MGGELQSKKADKTEVRSYEGSSIDEIMKQLVAVRPQPIYYAQNFKCSKIDCFIRVYLDKIKYGDCSIRIY